MGFKNSPMIIQRARNKILGEMMHKNVMVYMDDIIIYSK